MTETALTALEAYDIIISDQSVAGFDDEIVTELMDSIRRHENTVGSEEAESDEITDLAEAVKIAEAAWQAAFDESGYASDGPTELAAKNALIEAVQALIDQLEEEADDAQFGDAA